MYQTGTVLLTEADFDNAIWTGCYVELWQQGECVHPGGIAEMQTAYWVKIGGAIYFKYSYQFRVGSSENMVRVMKPDNCKRIH